MFVVARSSQRRPPEIEPLVVQFISIMLPCQQKIWVIAHLDHQGETNVAETLK